ncbi:hypothetical protein [Virgibacillus sediminis]|uniref:Uncharacterized protein n=1 Tax=Virgibacillus sediminis TaxID=202260 RepID=A0ABV7AAV4_9BACI
MLDELMDRTALLSEDLKTEYILFAVLIICILVVYKAAEPVVHWMVWKKYTNALCYMVSSLSILAGGLLIALWSGDEVLVDVLKVCLQAFTVFGAGLVIVNFYRLLFAKN